jgi:hypothetical protein
MGISLSAWEMYIRYRMFKPIRFALGKLQEKLITLNIPYYPNIQTLFQTVESNHIIRVYGAGHLTF